MLRVWNLLLFTSIYALSSCCGRTSIRSPGRR